MGGYRYKVKDTPRDGEHYVGVPARDLTADEFATLTEAQQEAVKAGGLYEPVVPLPSPAPPMATGRRGGMAVPVAPGGDN